MNEELEQALRRALRPGKPGEDFADRIISRLDAGEAAPSPPRRLFAGRSRAVRSLWAPAALAACVIAGVGLMYIRQAREAEQATQARAELLQALSIASDNINVVRAAVAREENPDS